MVNIYLAKEWHLADHIFLIFDMIILSESIAFWLCYNKYSRRIFYFWHRISSCFWLRRESTGVKLPNTFNEYMLFVTPLITNTQFTRHWKGRLTCSYWSNHDRTSEVFIWITKNVPQPKFPEQDEIKKIMEVIFTLTQWLKNCFCFLICNGDRDRQVIGYEFLKLVVNVYLAKEGHLADCISLIYLELSK